MTNLTESHEPSSAPQSSNVSLATSIVDQSDQNSESSGSEEHNIWKDDGVDDDGIDQVKGSMASLASKMKKLSPLPHLTLPEELRVERVEEFGELMVLRALMEQYSGGEQYNGVLVLPLRKFRQLCKEAGLLDADASVSPITIGDINVTYQTAVSHVRPAFGDRGIHRGKVTTLDRIEQLLWQPNKKFKVNKLQPAPVLSPRHISKKKEFLKKRLHGGGGAIHSERMMVPCQFRAALVELSTIYYGKMITKCFGRSILHLQESERKAAEEAAFEVLYKKKLRKVRKRRVPQLCHEVSSPLTLSSLIAVRRGHVYHRCICRLLRYSN